MTTEATLSVRTVGVVAPGIVRDAGVPEYPDVVAIPVRTGLVVPGDDIVETVVGAVRNIAHPGDVVAVSETAVAIAQGRLVPAEMIRPGRLAYALSRRAGAMATVNQPESLQLVIDRVGAWRVVQAAAAHVVGRLRGRRGDFYRVLGEAISEIDGYTGTLPPFERTIVLGPEDPAGVAERIAGRTGCGAAIVDVNDLGIAKVLGCSSEVCKERVAAALLSNPHGNGDEQTPIVVLAWRGDGEPALLQRSEASKA